MALTLQAGARHFALALSTAAAPVLVLTAVSHAF